MQHELFPAWPRNGLFISYVSKTVTMLCVDFAARDPAHDCTAIATTVQFVAREA